MSRQWTEEEKQAQREKMKAIHAQRKAAQFTESTTVPADSQTSNTANANSAHDVDEDVETVSKPEDNDRVARLEAQIELLLKMQGANVQTNQNAPEKTKTPYNMDLSVYEDPSEKLMEWASTDRRMRQKGFVDNYELQFVREETGRYPLADGSYMNVPKFTLGLLELAYDDDGNVLTRVNNVGETVQIKYLRKRLVMFEDPDNAIRIAERKGLHLDDSSSQRFLNDMRLLQAQDWLLEVFYPPKPTNNAGFREEAIGGQMVTIIETPTQWEQAKQGAKLRV